MFVSLRVLPRVRVGGGPVFGLFVLMAWMVGVMLYAMVWLAVALVTAAVLGVRHVRMRSRRQ
jgi:hypothetical protein